MSSVISPRSFLFAPGDNARLLAKVTSAGADAVVLDLEDGVGVAGKEAARKETRQKIQESPTSSEAPEMWVRINALDGELWHRDIEAVITQGLDGIRIPKAESMDSIAALATAVAEREAAEGLESGSIRFTCTIESAAGLLACQRFAEVPRVGQLAFGEADFIADIGARPVPLATLWARSQLVVMSRATGLLPPIAPVYTHLTDEEGLRRSSEQNRDLGFGGRSCIHPGQLRTVHSVFSPSEQELAWAREVWAAESSGRNRAGNQFIDEAVARRARALLERVQDEPAQAGHAQDKEEVGV